MTTFCCKTLDHSMNAAATRPLGLPRRASITRGLEKAAAYPERCSSDFDSSMLPETSAASTRRRSTRSAARVEVQAVVAISAATTKVRKTRIMLTPYSSTAERGRVDGGKEAAREGAA